MRGDFEFELGELQVCMMVEVQAVLVPFTMLARLTILYSYNANKAHNLLALMLDLHFKSLNVVKVFVGWAKVIQLWLSMTSRLYCHCWW